MTKRKLRFGDLLFPKTRPKCPRCKASNPISRGIEWGCKKCGRRWPKKMNWGRNYETEERKQEMDNETD